MYYLATLIINIIITIYKLQFKKIEPDKISLDDFLRACQTGDIIAFKAVDNYSAIKHGSYFTHLGIVYVLGEKKYLFEADHHHMKSGKSGIVLSELKTRILTYKGYSFHYKLKEPITPEQYINLTEFINYSLEHMRYQKSIFKSWIDKFLGYNCSYETNCAELVFLSFIKIGFLELSKYNEFISNYIKWIFTFIENSNRYELIKEITINRYGESIEAN